MSLVAWILLVPFGLIALRFVVGFLLGGTMNIASGIFMVFCLFVVALSAGYLWGGLDKLIQ